MYCPECGTKIEDNNRFCPECGAKIEEVKSGAGTSQEVNTAADEGGKGYEVFARGILFTNITLLAKSMGCSNNDVAALLQQFIDIKAEAGIEYNLLDAGNYTYKKEGFFGKSRTVALDENSEVWDYTDVLYDYYKRLSKENKCEVQYLFIVGGDNVIPMPCIKHYIPNDKHDDTIDTDILYAYPYGRDMLPLIENQEIFKYDQLFFLGRLPFGTDASLTDLANYLQRDINYTCGIPFQGGYGQCDPNWKNTSLKVAKNFYRYFRNFDGRLSSEYYFNRLILSPMVYVGNVADIFHTDASLFYFNLHGGKAVESRGYAGAELGGARTFAVLSPEHLATCKQPNIVVSEACYGGRFIGLDKQHSMMLSAIHTNSMSFVGSSRVAWGGCDTPTTTPQNAYIGNADIIAQSFTEAVLQGYTTGQAMFIARSNVLKAHKEGDPKAALTIVEFNLYGDPTMFFVGEEENDKASKEVELTPYADKDAKLGCKVNEVSSTTSGSILDMVRNAVDANIMSIHQTIGKYLYENFNIEPRQPSCVLRMQYNSGNEEYSFKYTTSDNDSETPMYIDVRTSKDGNILSVESSK